MKKAIVLVLALVLCLTAAACSGKSEAVKAVEESIAALGDITAQSGEAIQALDQAYNALSEEEKAKVENAQVLLDAVQKYYGALLAGEWCPPYVNYWDLNKAVEESAVLVNADGTLELDGTKETWTVTNGVLTTSKGPLYFGEDEQGLYLAYSEDDTYRMRPREAMEQWVSDHFLEVDLSQTDVSQVCDFYIQDCQELNDWDEPTGNVNTIVMLGSKLSEEGWRFYSTSPDTAIEVLIPAYTETFTWGAGQSNKNQQEARTETAYGIGSFVAQVGGVYTYNGETNTTTSDLTADQLSFGRAKGKLYFVKQDLVQEEYWQDRYSRILKLNDGNDTELYVSSMKDYWSDEHPF